MRALAQTPHIAAARGEFREHGSVADDAVDHSILTSWRRSRMAGVAIDRPDIPYHDTIDLRSRLVRCAAPVLQWMEDRLHDMPVCIALTDAEGHVVERRDNDPQVAHRHDRACFAPGFRYAESDAGTNGVGTAIETGRAVFVWGPEHFTEQSTPFACAGAPIRNPLTGRLEGLIDLSSRAEDAHPMMLALAEDGARDIERLLVEDGSERQRRVLEEFLAACRRSRGAVLSVSGEIIIANERASNLLTPADQAVLRLAAADPRGLRSESVIEMALTEGRWARVRYHPVSGGSEVTGAVFEVSVIDGRPARTSSARAPARMPLPGLVGRSPAWVDTCRQVREAALLRAALLIVGEQGVGKLALARAAHQNHTPTGAFTVVDCAHDVPDDVDDLLAADRASTVVLQHLELLEPAAAARLSDGLGRLAQQERRPWVVGTASAGLAMPDLLLGHFSKAVMVPPLRHRVDDLNELVPALLRGLAPSRQVECTADAARVLAGIAWQGNVAELRQVLRAALERRPVGAIRREDLPSTCFTTSRRTLTPLEVLERDAIVRALGDAGGNRVRAAQILEMSRSSLYRKIHAYGITYVAAPADAGGSGSPASGKA